MKKHLSHTKLICYTHGDILSRELRITEHICQSSDVSLHKEVIGSALLDPERLQSGFDRVETVIPFPWHRASQVLADLGVRSISAGVYGEVLGGHYGSMMLLHGVRKISEFAAQYFDWTDTFGAAANADVLDFLRILQHRKPWYMKEIFWNDIDCIAAMNLDTEATVVRLKERGIANINQLIEAFISEHRGSQYICSQLLSLPCFSGYLQSICSQRFFNPRKSNSTEDKNP